MKTKQTEKRTKSSFSGQKRGVAQPEKTFKMSYNNKNIYTNF